MTLRAMLDASVDLNLDLECLSFELNHNDDVAQAKQVLKHIITEHTKLVKQLVEENNKGEK